MQVQEGLEHIQHARHLGEDQGFVAPLLQLVKKSRQLLQGEGS